MVDMKTLLGSAVIAAICSGLISYIISRREGNLHYITGERKDWREKMRSIARRLKGASYKDTLKIMTELKVRINAFGNNGISVKYSDDAHIWQVINDLENEKPSKQILELKQKQLIEYISLLLKFDWERSKKEVTGNLYEIASWIVFGATGIFLVFLFWVCSINNDISMPGLIAMIAVYILACFFANFILIPRITDACKILIEGVITVNPKKHNDGKLVLCYLFELIGFIILLVVNILFLHLIFDIYGNQEKDIYIISIITMYAFGLYLSYAALTINLEQEFRYTNAIEEKRYSFGEEERKIRILNCIKGKSKKFKKIYKSMLHQGDADEFVEEYKKKFPEDWILIEKTVNEELNKSNAEVLSEQYLKLMYQEECKKYLSKCKK